MSTHRVVPNLQGKVSRGDATFFHDVLGLDLAMDLGFISTFASPSASGAQLNVLTEDPSGFHPDYSVGVDNVDAAYDSALRRGDAVIYPLTDEPWGVRRFFVRDPTGSIANVVLHKV